MQGARERDDDVCWAARHVLARAALNLSRVRAAR